MYDENGMLMVAYQRILQTYQKVKLVVVEKDLETDSLVAVLFTNSYGEIIGIGCTVARVQEENY